MNCIHSHTMVRIRLNPGVCMGRATEDPEALNVALAIAEAIKAARDEGHFDLAARLQAVLDDMPMVIGPPGPLAGRGRPSR